MTDRRVVIDTFTFAGKPAILMAMYILESTKLMKGNLEGQGLSDVGCLYNHR